MRSRLRRRDDGFTLIELLIVIVILGVITAPVTNLVIQGLKYYTSTQARLADSNAVQISTAYFSKDAANTGSRDYVTDPANGTAQQSIWVSATGFPGSYCGQGLGSTVMLLTWDTISVSGVGVGQVVSRERDSVSYIAISGALHRLYCPGTIVTTNLASALGTSVVSNATLATNYVFPDTSGGNPTPVTCSTSCISATLPTSINFKLSIKSARDTSITYVTLTGDRRQT
jgi:prepilin-type N-terminal cleavage/methylation domain-containing protein